MSIFEKIKHWAHQNHSLMMILCCAIPIILVLLILPLFGFSTTSLSWLILLLCPLLHIIMMKGMMNGGCHGNHKHKESIKNKEYPKEKDKNEKDKNKK